MCWKCRCKTRLLLPDDIDGYGNCLWRHAGVVIAGLVAETSLDEVIAGRSHDARLDGELAGVDAEFGSGIEGEREVRAGRVDGPVEMHAGACGNCQGGWDEFFLPGRVGVDVQPRRDAEVQGDCGRFGGGNGDLLRIEKYDGGLCGGARGGIDERPLT